MRKDQELPLVAAGTRVTDVLVTMTTTAGRPGAALVTGASGELVGIFTDGDLRRLLEVRGPAELESPVDEFMGRRPKSVRPDQLVEEAETLMRKHRIDQIAVLDARGRPVGLLDVQDLLDIRL
jgi:arabinose-5-phosphate isomerase